MVPTISPLLLALFLLAQPPAPPPAPPAAAPPPMPAQAAAAVSPDRLIESVRRLASFGTRHTLSTTTDPARGIGAARAWIKSQFAAASPRLQVAFDEFDQPKAPRIPSGAHIVNVVATLPGSDPAYAQRQYLVMGHYDSRNSGDTDFTADAPGANDDASGTALTLEAARVLAALPIKSTVVFITVAAEEQGLNGSHHYAEQAAATHADIRAVLSNDIVGDPSTPDGFPPTPDARTAVRLFSEGVPRNPGAEELARIRSLSSESDSPSRELARYIADVADTYNLPVKARLIFRPDRFLRGGDHLSFNDAGFAAVRFTEFDEDFSRQHQNIKPRDGKPYGDLPEFVDPIYLAGVAKLNIAAIVALANAPSAPANARMVTAKLENGTTLRWSPSPEPDVAGYEVLWRDTTAPQWQHVKDVGNVTTTSLQLSKDDFFFAIRAYARDGYRSVPAFAASARN